MTFGQNPLVVMTAVLYLAGLIAVGLWSGRRTRTASDFWIAGQRIGLWVTGLATASSAFSGFVFIGGPGLMYEMGMASLFVVVSVSFTPALLCWVLAKRLRLLAEVREVYTIPDVILLRYRSRPAQALAALAIVVGTVSYLGSQFLALGRLLEVAFGARELLGPSSLAVAIAFGVAVVLVYSVLGGMVAGAYTDLLQGALMVVVALLVFFQALLSGGGLSGIIETLSHSPAFGASFLDPLATTPVFTAFGLFFVFAVGTLGQPHMLHKFFMIDDPVKLKWLPLVIGATQSLCLLLWLGVGLAVPALVAQGHLSPLGQPDDAAPIFLLDVAPPLLAGLAFAGILAAVMSTADAFMNIGSAALVRDLPKAFGSPVANELFWGRLSVVAVSAAAAVSAYLYGDLVALLGTFAFGTFGAALGPALAIGLNWRRVTARAAMASMMTGIAVSVCLPIVSSQDGLSFAPGVLPAAVATASSFTVLFAVSLLERETDGIDEDVSLIMDV